MPTDDPIYKQVAHILKSYTPILTRETSISVNFDLDTLQNYDVTEDRLQLVSLGVPYAGQRIKVFVYSEAGSIFPDIIFEDRYKNFCYVLSSEDVSSFSYDDESSLTNLLQQIFQNFRLFNIEKICHDILKQDILSFQTSLIKFDDDNDCGGQLEVLVEDDMIMILMGLELDTSNIPAYLAPEPLGPFEASVSFTFAAQDPTRKISPEVHLSQAINNLFETCQVKLKCPKFDFLAGDCLPLYKQYVEELIQTRLNSIGGSQKQREAVLVEMKSKFAFSVMEFDSDSFSWILLLLEWRDFYFTVKVTLPLEYPHPTAAPDILFISIYHEKRAAAGQRLSQTASSECKPVEWRPADMPYSPRWDAKEMANRIEEFIVENVHKFLVESTQHGAL